MYGCLSHNSGQPPKALGCEVKLDSHREQLLTRVIDQVHKVEQLRAKHFGHQYDPEKVDRSVHDIPTDQLELMAVALDLHIQFFLLEGNSADDQGSPA